MNQAMLDIETLGRTPGCVVTEIAVVTFNKHSILNEFFAPISIRDSINEGLFTEPDTLNWWLTQDRFSSMISACQNPNTSVPLYKVLSNLQSWYHCQYIKRLWAYGSTFDVSILEACFNKVHMDKPWSYRDIRDTRFFKDLTWQPSDAIDNTDEHNALSDALYQAKLLQLHLNNLEEKGLYSWEGLIPG